MTMYYSEAKKLLESAKNRSKGKPLENNTRLIESTTDPKSFGIKLHSTEIITITPESHYILRTGGWNTITTRQRLNKYSPVRIYQESKIWYVLDSDDNRYLFEDDCEFDVSGKLISSLPSEKDITKIKKAKKKVDKLVRKYINGYIEEIRRLGEKFPLPNNGDCWGCLMVDVSKKDNTNSLLRSEAMGVSHYFDHFREKYYVPSILYKALRRRGNPGFCYQIGIKNPDFFKYDLQYFFSIKKEEMAKYLVNQEEE